MPGTPSPEPSSTGSSPTGRIPVPSVVVLVGAPGSGKSTWAASTFGDRSVVSSDALRALVGEDDRDQRASVAAFDLLEQAVDHRLRRGLTTVVDTTGLDAGRRRRWREAAAAHGIPAVVVVFDVPAAVSRERNRTRARRVPERVIDDQTRTLRAQRSAIEAEGWDLVVVVDDATRPAVTTPAAVAENLPGAARQQTDPVGLRFGLHLGRFAFDGGPARYGEHLTAIARAAEEAGFASLWVMDHAVQIPQVGRAWDDILEPFTTLAHLAAATDRVTVGTLVAGVTHRHPAVLGKAMDSLDVLSGGRAVCGIGAAWYEREHVAFGRPLPPLADRHRLLEDVLGFLPVLWGPGTKGFEGAVLHVPEAICYPRPLQDPLPILVGGQGERRTLRLVARHADACNLFGPPEVVAHKRAVLDAHCADVDRDPGEVATTHLADALVGRDDAQVADLVDAHGPGRGLDRWRARVHAGTIADQVGRYRALADAGVDEAIVSLAGLTDATAVERFAPVVAAFS